MIAISTVQLGAEVEDLVLEVLRSGAIAQGPMVARLEDEFAHLAGAPHAIAVNNGTTALVAALEVLDLKPGDEIITSPFTFVATLNAILESGATARFADIRDDDFNFDPQSVEALINERTRVLLPVHLYGQMADMDPLVEIARRHGLTILEDSAQSHGASYRGRPAGSYGLGTFSLYATKNITSGEGGIITTDDPVKADRLRLLRNQGMRERYIYEVAGHNYRLTDIQAAIAIPQLSRYQETVAKRQHNAATLSAGLADLPGLVLPAQLPERVHVWHQYTVRLAAEARIDRQSFAERLGEAGVGSGIYYPRLVNEYDAYRGHPRVAADPSPVASRVVSEVISLPVHSSLSDAELQTIIAAVTSAVSA
jgi:perosamine synthetase